MILSLLLVVLPLLSLTSCDDDENVLGTGSSDELEWSQGLYDGKAAGFKLKQKVTR